ncbi:hypothetical protein ACN20G_20510 [Streptomyces sp. BI20]|uniref:hypothetical protein n=1 Tax=Streptomyces sp. BI20 TaxID=3403460 RepID=UPI003C748D96
MSDEQLGALAKELGGAVPPGGFRELTDAELARLADALRRDREQRAEGLTEAAEKALALVPALARGPVRKILFR